NTPLTPMLGGGAAVLLQVAHPLVAAGVAQHSDYHRDLWRRLARTLQALSLMTLGTKTEAARAAAAVQAGDARVPGTPATGLGPLPAALRVFAPAHRLATAALLPPRLRLEYGLPWTPARRLALPLAARTVKLTTKPVLRVASRVAPLPRVAAVSA